MSHKFTRIAAAVAIGLLGSTVLAAPAFASEQSPTPQTWAAWGGELGFIWNTDLLRDAGVTLDSSVQISEADQRGFVAVAIRDTGGLEFAVSNNNFEHFVGGGLSLRGGFTLQLPDGSISLVDASLRPRAGDPLTLDLISADGHVWFYLDRLMYELADHGSSLHVRTMDLRIAPALAQRLGKPQIADWEVAQLRMDLNVFRQGQNPIVDAAGAPNWPGNPAPDGTKYLADVFMVSFTAQFSRCRLPGGASGSCDGPAATTDGEVVFTPSSTLSNNYNNGSVVDTVPGDPLGKSTALYTADVAWFQKFTAGAQNLEPYHMDQHPNLIWNLYRIDSSGKIEQIGRSGVKHAFLTTNQGSSCDNSNGSHVLGIKCSDTYGTGNNDSSTDLGPRSEIVPANVLWGRCGSIYDTNCDQTANASPNTSYDQRMITRETQIAAANNPGATYYFESWYLVRDDINIYNTMAVRPVTFSFAGTGGPWAIANGSPLRLGPAINRWVDPASTAANERNVEIASDEGHTRIAVKATDLGGGQWRYDYAVMNFDFARASTTGTPTYLDDADPAQRFHVVHNLGYDRFRVPLPAGVVPTSVSFADGDLNATNDWSFAVGSSDVSWVAPVNPTPPVGVPAVLNALNWGTMFRFSFVANAAPAGNNVTLHVAETGVPQVQVTNLIGPGSDLIYVDNFDIIPQRPAQ